MSEKQALILDVGVGCLVSWGSVILLNAVGVNGQMQALVGIVCMAVTCFLIGVIGVHYERKENARQEEVED